MGAGDEDTDELLALLDEHGPELPVAELPTTGVDPTVLERLRDAVTRAQVAADVDHDGRLTVRDLLTWLQQH